MEDLSIFSIDMLVFVDESGSDNRDTLRKYGYSLRGQPAKALSLFPRGKHLSEAFQAFLRHLSYFHLKWDQP